MTEEQERQQEAVAEAVLFTLGKSVETSQLAAALLCTEKEAAAIVERLRERYEREQRGMQIIKLDKRWQMATRKEYYDALIRVAKAPKKQTLSPVVLETLSIIAYKQPVTKTEITRIRGVSSDHAVNRLIEYGLVYEAGRLDAPGRPAVFATTEEFLRRFGVTSGNDLPETTPDQEAEIAEEVRKEVNYRFGTEPGEIHPEEENPAKKEETGEKEKPAGEKKPGENEKPGAGDSSESVEPLEGTAEYADQSGETGGVT